MSRHANPRVYIGPRTNEIIVPLSRANGVDLGDGVNTVSITFTKRSVSSPVESIWSSYAVKNGFARFQVPSDFKSNAEDYPKGFYDGVVKIDECYIGDVELVKAPSFYLGPADSVEDGCHSQDEWVEPECANELLVGQSTCGCNCNGDPNQFCDCSYQVKNNCPTCYNQQIVATIAVHAYAGLDEIDPDNCPLPDGSEEVQLCDETTGDCINVPTGPSSVISLVQETTKEGYVEDDNDC